MLSLHIYIYCIIIRYLYYKVLTSRAKMINIVNTVVHLLSSKKNSGILCRLSLNLFYSLKFVAFLMFLLPNWKLPEISSLSSRTNTFQFLQILHVLQLLVRQTNMLNHSALAKYLLQLDHLGFLKWIPTVQKLFKADLVLLLAVFRDLRFRVLGHKIEVILAMNFNHWFHAETIS